MKAGADVNKVSYVHVHVGCEKVLHVHVHVHVMYIVLRTLYYYTIFVHVSSWLDQYNMLITSVQCISALCESSYIMHVDSICMEGGVGCKGGGRCLSFFKSPFICALRIVMNTINYTLHGCFAWALSI